MALSFQERLAHSHDTQPPPDPFGRRPATPNEILQATQTHAPLNHGEIFETRLIEGDWKELKRQRDERRLAAKSLKGRRR